MLSSTLNSISIDRRSTLHYDVQLKENIKALILDRTLYYNTELPSIDALSKHLNIEEKFVIKAYELLLLERYIQKENGGYVVSYIELTNYFFERNTSIYDAIISLGLKPSIKCLEKKVVELDKEKMNQLGFKEQRDNRFLYINRIYSGDKQPIIVLENYLPLHIFKNMENEFKGTEPLNQYIQENYGFNAHISKRTTKCVNLPKHIAKILNERPNAASLQSTNQIYDKFGRMIDFGQSHSISSYYFQAIVNMEK